MAKQDRSTRGEQYIKTHTCPHQISVGGPALPSAHSLILQVIKAESDRETSTQTNENKSVLIRKLWYSSRKHDAALCQTVKHTTSDEQMIPFKIKKKSFSPHPFSFSSPLLARYISFLLVSKKRMPVAKWPLGAGAWPGEFSHSADPHQVHS